MEKTRILIKQPNQTIKYFCVENIYLSRLVTNLKLYLKDISHIEKFINEYSIEPCEKTKGFLVIDMVNNIILDNQTITGINKITPSEVRSSLVGLIPDETLENSLIGRFQELVDAGYLEYFEDWNDHGLHMNKIIDSDVSNMLNPKNSYYGQFIFSTKPYKVETFSPTDYQDQIVFLNRMQSLELITKPQYDKLLIEIQKLK